MAKKVEVINKIQDQDVTAQAVTGTEKKVTRRGKSKSVKTETHAEVEAREADLAVRLMVAEARIEAMREADARLDAMRKETLAAMAAVCNYNNAILTEAIQFAAGRNYSHIESMPADPERLRIQSANAKFNARGKCVDGLHYADESKTAVADSIAAYAEAGGVAEGEGVPAAGKLKKQAGRKSKATEEKPAETVKTEKPVKTISVEAAHRKYGRKSSSKPRRKVQFEEEYQVIAKNGITYNVGKFHRTDNGKLAYAVFMDDENYSKEGQEFLKGLGCKWSAFAIGYLFNEKPDRHLKAGKATKKAVA